MVLKRNTMTGIKKYLTICLTFILVTVSFSASFELNLENDCIIPNDDDSDYSHGTELKYMSDKPWWAFDNVGFSIVQNMYTPDNIDSDDIQYDDRPYCGLLLGNLIGQKTYNIPAGIATFEYGFGIGVVGENSFAEETQKLVHDIRNVRDPKGWKNQISNELILQYQVTASLNTIFYESENFNILAIPYTTVYLGNFKTQFNFGFDFRIGLFPPNKIGNNFIFSNERKRNFDAYLLVGTETRIVLHDMSLDGNVFRDSIHHVESETYVSELHYGLHIDIYNFSIEYLMVNRTREYVGQDEPPDYGRISIEYKF